MTDRRKILLLGGRSAQEHGLIAGCRRYLRQHELPWRLQVRKNLDADAAALPPADAVIGFLKNRELRTYVRRHRVPVAGVGQPQDGGPRSAVVAVDNAAVGALAADFAVQQGCAALGLIGWQGRRSFRFTPAAERAGQLGLPVRHYRRRLQDFDQPSEKDADLQAWLARQPRPLLAFCIQDKAAAWCAGLCVRAGIAVPEVVSVLGVDDDAWLCEQQQPTLSSIRIPWALAGYHCALQLHRLLSGAKPEPVLLQPLGVTERESTRQRHIDDPLLTAVFTYLDDHMAQSPRLGAVADRFGVSRQTLHRRCHRLLGITTETWWLERRLQRATDLLRDSRTAIATIAAQAGFSSPDRFRHAFRQRFGQSPSLFRALSRL